MRSTRALAAVVLLASCSGNTTPSTPVPASPTPTPSPVTTGARLSEPYPYVTPTPARSPTPVDGVYRREIGPDLAGGAGACRRCPPYRMEEGTQTLRLDRGVFFIENEVLAERSIDWRSIGHFTVKGNRIRLFNDPNCPTAAGTYEWSLEGGALTLEVVDDPCAFGGLRWRYLSAARWAA